MPPDMPAPKFRPWAEHDDTAAGHVLAPVVADALDDGERPELRTQKRSPTTPRRKISPPWRRRR
jgi:hypothetical protein